jgi:uncharacterized protein with PIN domain
MPYPGLRQGARSGAAALDFGDALARRLELPLLFKGDDFAQKDIPLPLTGS